MCEQETPDRVGFRLQAEGITYGLALDKKDKLEATQPCTFLVENGDGTSRCGVYEDRPIACVTYPMSRMWDRIAVLPSALCPPDAWAPDEPLNPHWTDGLRRLSRYRDTYVEVVNRWNAWVAAHPQTIRPPEHFIAYVLQTYERLADLDRGMPNDAIARIEQSWASLPPDSPTDASREREPDWIAYLRKVRAVIDEFFPEVAPLPFARIALERRW
jgi:Fe-S-cluster containining protein